MFSRNVAAVIAFISLTVSVVIACGPNFPWQLLDDRPATFKAAPVNSFVFQAVRIAPPPTDKLKAIESDAPDALPKAEAMGLSSAQSSLLQQIRTDATGDQAYQQGASLPESARLYVAGAIDFRRRELAKSQQRFEAILQLPESDRLRATWAAYMLGRTFALNGNLDQAAQEFQLTRQVAIQGAPDPMGLAVASYGEEAQLHLNRAKVYLLPKNVLPKERVDDCRREMVAAISLYAEQAARNSRSGVDSLREVAGFLMQPSGGTAQYDALNASIEDPIVQELIVAYGLSYFSTAGVNSPTGTPLFRHGVIFYNRSQLARIAWPDQVAALAYREADYDLAHALADHFHTPLASWVEAKLALQLGDLRAAAAFYAEAAHAFPPTEREQDLDEHNGKLVIGEEGALALARGEYVAALRILYPVADTYWGDVAYIAERVLTTNELKRFVDAQVPAPVITPAEDRNLSGWTWDANSAARLRDLLARRLVREQRYDESLPYFHSPNDGNFADPRVREEVIAYSKALHIAYHSWRRVDRARGWYQAAVLARQSGMAMMGYELQPDYFMNDGAIDGGFGQDSPGHCWVTDGEQARFDATKPKVDLRLHYRFIAVNEALQAADLLPPRSQAFAAVLCRATNWMKATAARGNRDYANAIANQLYKRYLTEGAYVPWGRQFGRICWSGGWQHGRILEPQSNCGCPEPDFDSAARLPRVLFVPHTRHFVKLYRWPLGISFGALLVAVGAGLIWMRRRAT
jgi:hypothetical protein